MIPVGRLSRTRVQSFGGLGLIRVRGVNGLGLRTFCRSLRHLPWLSRRFIRDAEMLGNLEVIGCKYRSCRDSSPEAANLLHYGTRD